MFVKSWIIVALLANLSISEAYQLHIRDDDEETSASKDLDDADDYSVV